MKKNISLALAALCILSQPIATAYGQAALVPPNNVIAGPSSGVTGGFATPRALVGADLPNPSASTLGGVESLTCATHQWLNTISAAGVPSCAQPALADLSGSGVTRAGDIAYWNGSSWTTLAGNNSGTQILSENSSGVPAWTAVGTGTVTAATAGQAAYYAANGSVVVGSSVLNIDGTNSAVTINGNNNGPAHPALKITNGGSPLQSVDFEWILPAAGVGTPSPILNLTAPLYVAGTVLTPGYQPNWVNPSGTVAFGHIEDLHINGCSNTHAGGPCTSDLAGSFLINFDFSGEFATNSSATPHPILADLYLQPWSGDSENGSHINWSAMLLVGNNPTFGNPIINNQAFGIWVVSNMNVLSGPTAIKDGNYLSGPGNTMVDGRYYFDVECCSVLSGLSTVIASAKINAPNISQGNVENAGAILLVGSDLGAQSNGANIGGVGGENAYGLAVYAGVDFRGPPAGTTPLVAVGWFKPGLIVLPGGGAVTEASTIYVTGAPSGAANNYALHVNAGATLLGGTLEVAGALRFDSTLSVNGTAAIASQTCTVNQAKTLIFTNGILTGGTCNT